MMNIRLRRPARIISAAALRDRLLRAGQVIYNVIDLGLVV